MKPRVSLITLGVEDLERAVRFYRALGLQTPGIVGTEFEYGAVAFFELQPQLRLALWPRASLAHDAGLPVGPVSSTDVCLAHNVRTSGEVDAVIAQVAAAGGTVVKPPHETFYGGYAAYFKDPDQHLWEVAWNPAMLPPEEAA
jgi:catechol 2,3-dioxygenase-like lactoylglutathione lyase family enzyme